MPPQAPPPQYPCGVSASFSGSFYITTVFPDMVVDLESPVLTAFLLTRHAAPEWQGMVARVARVEFDWPDISYTVEHTAAACPPPPPLTPQQKRMTFRVTINCTNHTVEQPPPCSKPGDELTSCTTDERQRCYYDETCSTADVTFNGLGCNAGQLDPKCRFCGFDAYAKINCPLVVLEEDIPCALPGEAITACTANEREHCFWDTRCLSGDDPFGSLGCNADGLNEQCRFCGFGLYEAIKCPEEDSRLSTWQEELKVQLGAPVDVRYRVIDGCINLDVKAMVETEESELKLYSQVSNLKASSLTYANLKLIEKPAIEYVSIQPSPPPPTLPPLLPPPPSPPPPPPGVLAVAPCAHAGEELTACTANPIETCYYDARCSSADDPFGGLGCNAAGVDIHCRFCGFGLYESVPCSGQALDSSQTNALTQEDRGSGGLTSIAMAVVAILSLCVLLAGCCYQRRRLSRKRSTLREKPACGSSTLTSDGLKKVPTSGLKWVDIGTTRPTAGCELANKALVHALETQTEFTAQELAAFGLEGLRHDDFVCVGKRHYVPAVPTPSSVMGKLWPENAPADLGTEWKVAADVGNALDWSHLEVQSMLFNGEMGKLWTASLVREYDRFLAPRWSDDSLLECFPRGLLLRRLRVELAALSTLEEHIDHAASLCTLNHRHLLPFVGLVTDGLQVGELVARRKTSLDTVLRDLVGHEAMVSRMKVVAMHIAAEVAMGLAHLHAHGFAHLSLHPRNILLDDHMHVQLSDYSRTPKVLDQLLKSSAKTLVAAADPRWLYLPPETLRAALQGEPSSSNWDASIDLWSLGCIIVRLASLQPLYLGCGLEGMPLYEAIAQGKLTLTEQLASDQPTIVHLVNSCAALQGAERIGAAVTARELWQIQKSGFQGSQEKQTRCQERQTRCTRRDHAHDSRQTSMPAAMPLPRPARELWQIQKSGFQGSQERHTRCTRHGHAHDSRQTSGGMSSIPASTSLPRPNALPRPSHFSSTSKRLSSMPAKSLPRPNALPRPGLVMDVLEAKHKLKRLDRSLGATAAGTKTASEPLERAFRRPSLAAFYEQAVRTSEAEAVTLDSPLGAALRRTSLVEFQLEQQGAEQPTQYLTAVAAATASEPLERAFRRPSLAAFYEQEPEGGAGGGSPGSRVVPLVLPSHSRVESRPEASAGCPRWWGLRQISRNNRSGRSLALAVAASEVVQDGTDSARSSSSALSGVSSTANALSEPSTNSKEMDGMAATPAAAPAPPAPTTSAGNPAAQALAVAIPSLLHAAAESSVPSSELHAGSGAAPGGGGLVKGAGLKRWRAAVMADQGRTSADIHHHHEYHVRKTFLELKSYLMGPDDGSDNGMGPPATLRRARTDASFFHEAGFSSKWAAVAANLKTISTECKSHDYPTSTPGGLSVTTERSTRSTQRRPSMQEELKLHATPVKECPPSLRGAKLPSVLAEESFRAAAGGELSQRAARGSITERSFRERSVERSRIRKPAAGNSLSEEESYGATARGEQSQPRSGSITERSYRERSLERSLERSRRRQAGCEAGSQESHREPSTRRHATGNSLSERSCGVLTERSAGRLRAKQGGGVERHRI